MDAKARVIAVAAAAAALTEVSPPLAEMMNRCEEADTRVACEPRAPDPQDIRELEVAQPAAQPPAAVAGGSASGALGSFIAPGTGEIHFGGRRPNVVISPLGSFSG
jgi:hypothetical protein